MSRNKKRSPRRSRKPRNSPLAAAKPSSGPIQVKSQAAFDRHLTDARPTIVDFWAPWCAPCKTMAPIFDAVAQEMSDRVQFLKVDTERVPQLASAFGIRSIPTLIVLNGTEVTDSHIGLADSATLTRMARRAADRAEGVTLTDKLKRLFTRDATPAEEAESTP